MSRNVDNGQDILDSRDIIERISELESERLDLTEDKADELATWDEDYKPELDALLALAEEGEGSPDWSHGESLIRESYFKRYAEDFADDIGAIDRNANWPVNCIDWDEAAEQLKQDYFEVDFDGVTYLIRG